ncbi:hypothetical protein T03_4250 [Trichinella britovi]|uniref:Uncharacterized protein n=1 Tax=Trichinella britovi TaxID=45882 RepID=A0A0V1D4B5_TRIBR|nr:hypothetical protein T09_14045 [Trichinella sp. T9]KRY56263.1 hypothetical protein T03_4250 [Trichinella britovi]
MPLECHANGKNFHFGTSQLTAATTFCLTLNFQFSSLSPQIVVHRMNIENYSKSHLLLASQRRLTPWHEQTVRRQLDLAVVTCSAVPPSSCSLGPVTEALLLNHCRLNAIPFPLASGAIACSPMIKYEFSLQNEL